MKISDLLGDGWDPDDGAGGEGAAAEGRSEGRSDATHLATDRDADAEGLSELDPWVLPAPEPSSARAQLADLAAGLAPPPPDPEPLPEPEMRSEPDLPVLSPVVDDLLPRVRKRSRTEASRSGSRRRAR